MIKVPPRILTESDPQSTAIKQAMLDLATKARRNESEGALIPLEYDSNGHEMYQFELLTSGGKRTFDIGAAVTRYEQRMLMTCLADFIMLGHEGVGSLGLNIGGAKIDLYLAGVETWGEQIASQVTKAFAKLCVLNGFPAEVAPTYRFGPLQRVDLQEVGSVLLSLAQAGGVGAADPQVVDWVLTELGVPHEPAPETAPAA